MFRIHVLSFERRNSLVSFSKLQEICKRKFHQVANYNIKNDTMKVYFKEPISFSDIDKLSTTFALEYIKVKEMYWKFEKHLNGGTCILKIML